jgi:hypothetical protein
VQIRRGPSWSYGSLINNCNQYLLPPMFWVRTPFILDTTLCDKVCQWLAKYRWLSLGTLVSSINKTDRHNITEICLKVALNTTSQTKELLHFKVRAFDFLIVFQSILYNVCIKSNTFCHEMSFSILTIRYVLHFRRIDRRGERIEKMGGRKESVDTG